MIKPLLVVTSICISVLSVNAQITINAGDMPTPFKIFYQANDTLPTVSVGNAGPNQTWTMTSLAQHTIDTSNTMSYFYAPNAVFSTANLAIKRSYQENYGYFINSASSLMYLGGAAVINIQGTPTHINQVNTPAETAFQFPTAYNSTYNTNYFVKAKFYYGHTISGFMVDSILQKSGVQKTFLTDAWGTITTPLAGGAQNVLRIKETKISHDTTQAFVFGSWMDVPGGITFDTTITYNWWANGIGVPIATAILDSTGAVSNVQWLKSIPVVGIDESTPDNTISIYPNPATNQITVQFDASTLISATSAKHDTQIDITNELGQSVKKIGSNQFIFYKNEIKIDVADLPTGVYFIQIQNQGNTLNKKFIKL